MTRGISRADEKYFDQSRYLDLSWQVTLTAARLGGVVFGDDLGLKIPKPRVRYPASLLRQLAGGNKCR
jgi:hypothetical protein